MKFKKRVNLEIFDAVTIAADSFSASYDKAKEERDEALREAAENYRPNSKFLEERKEQIYADFADSVQAAKQKITDEFHSMLDSERDLIKTSLSLYPTDVSSLDLLSRLSDFSLSQAELDILSEKYGSSYWTNRAISELAQKNGLTVEKSIPVGQQLEILDDLDGRLTRFMDSYNDEGVPLLERSAVSPGMLMRLQEKYLSNPDDYLSSEQKAEKIISLSASSSDLMRRMVTFSNGYNGADEATRLIVLDKVLGNPKLEEIARMVGLGPELYSFEHGNARAEIEDARGLLEKAAAEKDVSNISAMLDEGMRTDNGFMKRMILEEARSKENPYIVAALMKSDVLNENEIEAIKKDYIDYRGFEYADSKKISAEDMAYSEAYRKTDAAYQAAVSSLAE